MPACGRGDITVLHWHRLTRPLEKELLIRPNVRRRHIEAEDSAFKGFNAPSEPLLQSGPAAPFLGSDPISDLSNHDGTRVTAALFTLKPFDHSAIAPPLDRLREHVRIQQPAHSLSFLGSSRLRGGRSSIATGHCLHTSSQFAFRFMRRRITVSSSGSKVASNCSPGEVRTSAAGMLTRCLSSSVTTIVGLSHTLGYFVNPR